MSEYHIATGNLPLSVTQLEMALSVPDITGVQRSRFQARLDEVREVAVLGPKTSRPAGAAGTGRRQRKSRDPRSTRRS